VKTTRRGRQGHAAAGRHDCGRAGGGLRFTPGSLSQLITALSPADSMVIVLSGADAQLVPMILT
jgi:hypothetical protein